MQSYQNMSDEELIAALRSGEKEITDYLMDKYKSLVKKKAKALYLIGGETDDLIQEGMIGLFKAVRDYQPDKDSSFFSFRRPLYCKADVYSGGGFQSEKACTAQFVCTTLCR